MTSGSLSVAKRDNLNASNNFRRTCRYMLVTTFCLFLVRLLRLKMRKPISYFPKSQQYKGTGGLSFLADF